MTVLAVLRCPLKKKTFETFRCFEEGGDKILRVRPPPPHLEITKYTLSTSLQPRQRNCQGKLVYCLGRLVAVHFPEFHGYAKRSTLQSRARMHEESLQHRHRHPRLISFNTSYINDTYDLVRENNIQCHSCPSDIEVCDSVPAGA